MSDRDYFENDFSYEIWKNKYKYGDETYEEFIDRVVNSIVNVEKKFIKNEKYIENFRNKLKEVLLKREISLGGRIFSNIGLEKELNTTLFNCFIMPNYLPDFDSLEKIDEFIKKIDLVLKSEGGVGFHLNWIRPKGTIIRGISSPHCGVVKYMELIDKHSEVITSIYYNNNYYQGKPKKLSRRAGAMLCSLSVYHPDIIDFINAKVKERLIRMNISVWVDNEFLEAVKNDREIELYYPDINFPKYKELWDGDLKKWRYIYKFPVVIYRKIKAREIWNLILKNMYNYGEPAFLFEDNIEYYNNLYYIKSLKNFTTNPCGEVFSPIGYVKQGNKIYNIGGICNLGSIVLPKYYDISSKKFDFKKLEKNTRLLVRILDNVYEISKYPLKEFEETAKLKRELGIGITGLGSLFYMMKVRYGSEESIKILRKIMEVMVNSAYDESVNLAIERGKFPLCDNEKIVNGGFIQNSGILRKEIKEKIKKYGLRNASLFAIAPTGNTSIYNDLVSFGCEPIFEKEYIRWVKVEDYSKVNFKFPNVFEGEWFETDYLKKKKLGVSEILESIDGEYRVEKGRGLVKKEKVIDYGWRRVLENLDKEEIKKLEEKGIFATTKDISVGEHLAILSLLAKSIDKSISKTVNIPSSYSFEEFKREMEYYILEKKLFLKGLTIYREGSRTNVIEYKNNEKKEKKFIVYDRTLNGNDYNELIEFFKEHREGKVIESVPKIPRTLPAIRKKIKAEGRKWYIIITFKDIECRRPLEFFIITNAKESKIDIFNAIEEFLKLAEKKGINKKWINKVKRELEKKVERYWKLGYVLSFLFRHNVSLVDIILILEKIIDKNFKRKGRVYFNSILYQIKKILENYLNEQEKNLLYNKIKIELGIMNSGVCPICGNKLDYVEGCLVCRNCGYSKCIG